MTLYIVLALLAGLAVGAGAAFMIISGRNKKEAAALVKEAEAKAEVLRKESELKARENFMRLKEKHEEEVNQRNQKVAEAENRIKQKENSVNQRLESYNRKEKEIESIKENLSNQLEIVSKKKEELEKYHQQQVKHLEKLAGLSAEQAKAELIESLTAEARTEAMAKVKDIVDEAKLTATKESRRIIIQTIQRTAAEQAIENSVSVFNIESDEVKGRIIGREGRNIRALEAATGIEIIVDDTPEAIILSGFDPIRREIARLSLHKLVSDGRIHPARISSWWAPMALHTSGCSLYFSASFIPRMAWGVSASSSGTLPISWRSPALFASFTLIPISAAMVAQRLATSLECCSRFCP